MTYVHNNGKGWAVFKDNPGHPCQRPWAYISESDEWSLVATTYFKTRSEALAIKEAIDVFDGTRDGER